jgi:hypothetical protein
MKREFKFSQSHQLATFQEISYNCTLKRVNIPNRSNHQGAILASVSILLAVGNSTPIISLSHYVSEKVWFAKKMSHNRRMNQSF